MKILPISNVERSFIIHHLKLHGNWQGKRAGGRVRIVRFPTASGERIIYSLQRGAETISAPKRTVFEAVGELNDLILAAEIYGAVRNRSLIDREPDSAVIAVSGD